MKKLEVRRLINQVRLRPILWDMSLDGYKCQAGKYEAWLDVCNATFEGFEAKSDSEKKIIVHDAKEKWKMLRDNFVRSKKKQCKVAKQGGTPKKYMYWDQLQFLFPYVGSQTIDTATPDLDCTEVTDFDPNEVSRSQTETDHLYVDPSMLSVSHPYKYEEIQICDAEDIIEIPGSGTDYFTPDKEVEDEMDVETLIDEVRFRPLLWDMSVDDYKDTLKKHDAWMEVCRAVYKGFEEKSDNEKTILVQNTKLRWRGLRDNFSRSTKKKSLTTPRGRRRKKYVYSDQLQFLIPTLESHLREPAAASASRKRVNPDKNCSEVSDCDLHYDNGQSQAESSIHISAGENVLLTTGFLAQPRNKRNLDEEALRTNAVPKKSEAEPVKMLSEDEQFFNSLLSSVAELSDIQKLQFRIEVMQALVRVKKSC